MATTPTAQTGKNVRAEMARAGVTQAALAAELGISQAAVSARLLGRTPFDINELTAVADALNVPLTTLLPAKAGSAA